MTKKKTTTKGKIAVKVARFGEPTIDLKLKKGATVEDAIEESGISVGSSEQMYVEGQSAELEDQLENGDLLQVVGRKEGGR